MFRNFFRSKIFTVMALGVIFLLAMAVLKIQPQKVEVEKRVQNFQDRIAELEKSNAGLGKLLDYFRSDPYLEREAKLKLNVKMPDENVAFLQESDVNPETISPENSQFKTSWLDRLANFGCWLKDLF